MEAKLRGAKIMHVDPRFTRTSAVADLHVPLRAGSDIAFLGGVINYILQNEREFRPYVESFTNASTIISEDYRDTEDLDGLFSGWDAGSKSYEARTWQYAGTEGEASGGTRDEDESASTGEQAHGAHGGQLSNGEPPETDPTLQHPRCVFQILKRHFARYTPDFVEEVCGVPQSQFLEVAEALCANSGRERTTAFCYSVGWTQHSVGVQYIRTAAIIQLLLGNIGRPGGGIMALRGHASIQGSTDIPTLYNILPGYLPMPGAGDEDLESYIAEHRPESGFWHFADAYTVSLLKAWYGEAATPENEFCFGHLPRINGEHSHYQTALDMLDGKVKGYFLMGQNPAVGSANGRVHRLGYAKLDWMVVRDFAEIESASFWREGPEIEAGELRTQDIQTEVFLMPAAAHTEKSGSFTNTQRLLQWHHQAVDPEGDQRSELWFMYHLGKLVREKLAGSTDPRDRAILDLAWDYPTEGTYDDPSAEAILKEISGYEIESGEAVSTYMDLKADGSTASGCWIYSGIYADEVNQAARRKPGSEQDWVAGEWGWAWPLDRRILYNRASADAAGKPWSERKRYVSWDAAEGKWTGPDVPDFTVDMPPGHIPSDEDKGPQALRGDAPFVMQADGRGWLFAPSGLADGPLPTHYEPHESPFGNPLHPHQRANPARQPNDRPQNRSQPAGNEPGSGAYPYVFTTYRLTEHHTAGGMSRTLPYLSELQPEMFCEVSPELAAERGLENAGWATLISARGVIEARVLVTERMTPLRVGERTVHQIGLPYHWGERGISTGDSANDLLSIVTDPNTGIGEYKAATCDIRAGRRPRGAGRRELVESHWSGSPSEGPG
jgi:formate dehydrogenase major subunit